MALQNPRPKPLLSKGGAFLAQSQNAEYILAHKKGRWRE